MESRADCWQRRRVATSVPTRTRNFNRSKTSSTNPKTARLAHTPAGVRRLLQTCSTSQLNPVWHRLGLLEAEMRVSPEKHEEAEVDERPEPAKQVLDRGQVRIRAEPFRNHFGGDLSLIHI